MYRLPEDILDEAGISEGEARLELACRLFDIGRLELWPAARLAGLSRVEMEAQLARRGIAIYRPTQEDVEQELAGLDRVLGPAHRATHRQ